MKGSLGFYVDDRGLNVVTLQDFYAYQKWPNASAN